MAKAKAAGKKAEDADPDILIVNGKEMKVVSAKSPAELPWKALGVDLVIESTGLFTDVEKAQGHITAGAKKVIISAPAKGDCLTVVMGVNEGKYDPEAASCHFQRELHDELPGAGRLCAAQGRVRRRRRFDDDDSQLHRHAKDRGRPEQEGLEGRPQRRRMNLIPSTTGAAKAVGLVLPEVKGKLTGMAFRVPTPTVSVG